MRIAILAGSKTMRADSIPDDVVLFRSVEFEQTQLWLRPLNAIVAFGIASYFTVTKFTLNLIPMGAAIIHSKDFAVTKNRVVSRCVTLPRLVRDQHDFPGFWTVQFEFASPEITSIM